MKFWVVLIVFSLGLGFSSTSFSNELFRKIATESSQGLIKNFVQYVLDQEPYPLMHALRNLRYTVLQKHLGIQQREDTSACSARRNLGTIVPSNKQGFCLKYDEIINFSKIGLVDVDILEWLYLQIEPALLDEVSHRKAYPFLLHWIDQEQKCLSDFTVCGKDEREWIKRIIGNRTVVLSVYQQILENLKQRVQSTQDLEAPSLTRVESPCSGSGNTTSGLKVVWGMVFVAEGPFLMGDPSGSPDEQPVHPINLDGFWMDRCEVTNDAFLDFVATNDAFRKGKYSSEFHDGRYLEKWGGDLTPPKNQGNEPVTSVSWFAAKAYCQSLSKRLATEAEWEKAARAFQSTPYHFGTDPTKLSFYAWFHGNADGETHPVGEKRPNAYGLYDLYGNVDEWVADRYGAYSPHKQQDPQGPSIGELRVFRGGSYHDTENEIRSSIRKKISPQTTQKTLGFRCVADSKPEAPSLLIKKNKAEPPKVH